VPGTTHVGATLRLLRIESGFGLRDFARRLGVSSAYLSRMENGVDGAPTPERLEAMARELRIPPTLLLDLAHRVSPLVVDYVQRVPEAGRLFLEIAHLGLTPAELGELRSHVKRQRPLAAATRHPPCDLGALLSPERVVLGLEGSDIEDAFDIAATRLAEASGNSARAIAQALREREREVSSAIGSGVAVAILHAAGTPPIAALVSLVGVARQATPDGAALRVVLVLFGLPESETGYGLYVAQAARLSAGGLAEELAQASSPDDALDRLRILEARIR
jgi:nitrogen PTS system EIIA component